MANWREYIDLHKVLDEMGEKHDLSIMEDDCPAEVKEAIAKELEKSVWLKIYAGQIRRARAIAAVNRILNRVYDAADQHLVWTYGKIIKPQPQTT